MARRLPPKPVLAVAQLSPEQMRSGIDRINKRIVALKSLDISSIVTGHEDALRVLEASIDEALTKVFGTDTKDYVRYKGAARLQKYEVGILYIGSGPQHVTPISEIRTEVSSRRDTALSLLQQAIQGLEEDLQDLSLTARPLPEKTSSVSNKVFVVHGHDEGALHGLARFLEHLELTAIVLREQPDQGRTIVEKFEDCAREVGFAVVLLTPDDVGGTVNGTETQARARQNVIFELGYFAGKLGRGKVCLLRKGTVEIPSDLYGVIYSELDQSEGWKLRLGRELKAAGLEIDLNQCL